MSHSYSRIWIHAVWSTKFRLPFIFPSVEQRVYPFITEQLREIDCPVRIVNGMPDHIHCLFLLNPRKSIAEVIKKIKGSSSRLINDHNMLPDKFAWQTGYAAFSVSESVVEKVFQYIKKQKQHHAHMTFQEEYDEYVKQYGWPSAAHE